MKAFKNYSFITVRKSKDEMVKLNPKLRYFLSLMLCSSLCHQVSSWATCPRGSLSHLCKGCLKGN